VHNESVERRDRPVALIQLPLKDAVFGYSSRIRNKAVNKTARVEIDLYLSLSFLALFIYLFDVGLINRLILYDVVLVSSKASVETM
jgi:hypothetical protein